MGRWVDVCATTEVDEEDLISVEVDGHDYAIYQDEEGEFFATDAHCTHEKVNLCDGLVMGDTIECPKHNGRFNYKTGEGLGAPVCIDLKTYPCKVEGERVLIELVEV
jgi:3-phenylpropionate/trans-cinnamate dioxygenase ferredoxin subunit